jgi:crossover junction endodeoxyribonuclease RuvC
VIILGIDPGTRVTGYGIIKMVGRNRYVLIDYGCIRPPPKLCINDRYLIIHEGAEELIEKHQPDVLSIETQFVHKNPQSAIKLGMARGVVIVAARKRGVDVVEYAPTTAKRSVTGRGQASKEQVQSMIQHLLGLKEKPTPEDAADALALAICHAQKLHTYAARD